MPRRNYTREILAEIADGRVPVNSLGPETRVMYSPRHKSDPQPWTNGFFRYSGRYVHTVEPCPHPFVGGRTCGLPKGHDDRLIHRVLPAV